MFLPCHSSIRNSQMKFILTGFKDSLQFIFLGTWIHEKEIKIESCLEVKDGNSLRLNFKFIMKKEIDWINVIWDDWMNRKLKIEWKLILGFLLRIWWRYFGHLLKIVQKITLYLMSRLFFLRFFGSQSQNPAWSKSLS